MITAAKKKRASKMVKGGEPLKPILAAIGPDAHKNANNNPMAVSTMIDLQVIGEGMI